MRRLGLAVALSLAASSGVAAAPGCATAAEEDALRLRLVTNHALALVSRCRADVETVYNAMIRRLQSAFVEARHTEDSFFLRQPGEARRLHEDFLRDTAEAASADLREQLAAEGCEVALRAFRRMAAQPDIAALLTHAPPPNPRMAALMPPRCPP